MDKEEKEKLEQYLSMLWGSDSIDDTPPQPPPKWKELEEEENRRLKAERRNRRIYIGVIVFYLVYMLIIDPILKVR